MKAQQTLLAGPINLLLTTPALVSLSPHPFPLFIQDEGAADAACRPHRPAAHHPCTLLTYSSSLSLIYTG